jgi:putative transposase
MRHALAMSNYRRMRVPGGTYFFTVNLLERRRHLLVDHMDALRAAFASAKKHWPFDIIAIVVLPEHLHCIWRLPEGCDDNGKRWGHIKTVFSRHMPKHERRSNSRRNRHERGIWQRRFWEHFIADEDDLNHHINYIYLNPLKHGYVQHVRDWPYSSFHRDVKRGLYPVDWAG